MSGINRADQLVGFANVKKELGDFDLLEFAKSWFGEILVTVEKKNADYTGKSKNPFKNFELIEHVSDGRISAEDGILVRRTDKIARVAGFLKTKDLAVVTESIDETLRDDAAYCMLMAALMAARQQKSVSKIPSSRIKGWVWKDGDKAAIDQRGAHTRVVMQKVNGGRITKILGNEFEATENIYNTLGKSVEEADCMRSPEHFINAEN